jgi:hypothetical protein
MELFLLRIRMIIKKSLLMLLRNTVQHLERIKLWRQCDHIDPVSFWHFPTEDRESVDFSRIS